MRNLGSLSLAFEATTTGGDWLTVTPRNGSVMAVAPVSLTVTVDPRRLPPGTYSGSVSVSSATTGQRTVIPITVAVSDIEQTIVLSQTGLTFTAVRRGSVLAPPGRLSILNGGQGAMEWTASASTLEPGTSWLSVTPATGVSTASQVPPSVEVIVNTTGLSPGDYYGEIRIEARGAVNSPQFALIVLNLLPEGSNPGPVVQPSALVFTTVEGDSPGAQQFQVYNLTSSTISFESGRTPENGLFVRVPASETVAPDKPVTVRVQPDLAALTGTPSGIRRGALTLVFNDGSIRPIELLLVVAPRSSTSSGSLIRTAHTGCPPARLLPVITSLGQGFNVTAAWPVALEATIVDDCGHPMVTGSVVASFSNGDPPLPLVPLRDGRWSGTWRPARVSETTIMLSAQIPDPQIRGESAPRLVGVAANDKPPVIFPNGVVSAVSFTPQAPVAPGAFVAIFGSRLADASLVIQGRLVRTISATDSQINAILPYDLPVNTLVQVTVRSGTRYSNSEPVTVAVAQPAIFTVDQSGKGQGSIYAPGHLVNRENAATTGDVIVIYCSGLGVVDPPVRAGDPAPLSPLSQIVHPKSLTIAGVQAQVRFAGLSPGSIGLYQVNAVVPDGIPPSDQAQVILTVAGQSSPPVTMAVR